MVVQAEQQIKLMKCVTHHQFVHHFSDLQSRFNGSLDSFSNRSIVSGEGGSKGKYHPDETLNFLHLLISE
jgi:hypothetical protein